MITLISIFPQQTLINTQIQQISSISSENVFYLKHVVTVLKSLKSYHKSTVCGCGCCCDAVVAITPFFCDAIVAIMPLLLWHHCCYDAMVAVTSWPL